ncbi:MAG: hypothetical protein DRN29_11085 [Thermoplasmata archaeon]|nr:MAG: hypothetical protein DRN29_11085 [Thermoplasmata archaeon]
MARFIPTIGILISPLLWGIGVLIGSIVGFVLACWLGWRVVRNYFGTIEQAAVAGVLYGFLTGVINIIFALVNTIAQFLLTWITAGVVLGAAHFAGQAYSPIEAGFLALLESIFGTALVFIGVVLAVVLLPIEIITGVIGALIGGALAGGTKK